MRILSIVLYSISLILISHGFDKNNDNSKFAVNMAGPWLVAWQSAEMKFSRLKKRSLDCYRVTATVHGDLLKVHFDAEPDPGFEQYRGQPPACGPSVIYEVNRNGTIVREEEEM